jgi:hypothetical protein
VFGVAFFGDEGASDFEQTPENDEMVEFYNNQEHSNDPKFHTRQRETFFICFYKKKLFL